MTPALLPTRLRPGDRIAIVAPAVFSDLYEYPIALVATCALGLEEFLEVELQRLGASNLRRERGAITFSGTWGDVLQTNWRLRTANRVLVDEEPVRQRRLLLCRRVLLILETGLHLLAIRTMKRM